jgi:hypothetical protein
MPQLQLKLDLIGIEDLCHSVPLVLPVKEGAIPAPVAKVAEVAGFTAGPEQTLLLSGHAARDIGRAGARGGAQGLALSELPPGSVG